MSNRTNLKTLLPMLVFLLAMVGTTFAEPLFPLQVGLRLEYNRRDSSGNDWPVVFEVDGQMTAKSFTYFHVQIWNYDNDGAFEDFYVRSTENEIYVYNPDGEDYLEFQKAPVGTKWSFYQEHDSGLNYTVTEIVDINTPENPVEIPYGTFDEAYVYRKYKCVNKFGQGKSRDWYNWVVPGIGYVKEVDYWNASPPMIEELVRVIIPADIDIDPNMLNVQSEGKWITWYIWLPEEYDVADIEPDSILLNGVIEAAWRWIDEEEQVLMAKFSRSDVQDIVEPGEVELTVSGELTDGTKFEGAVMITVID